MQFFSPASSQLPAAVVVAFHYLYLLMLLTAFSSLCERIFPYALDKREFKQNQVFLRIKI